MFGAIAYLMNKKKTRASPPRPKDTVVAVRRSPRGAIFGRGLTSAGSPIATIFSIGSSIASMGFRIIGFGLVLWGGLSIVRHAFTMVVGDAIAIGGHARDVKDAIVETLPTRT